MEVWESAKLLFNYKKVEGVFKKELPNADFRTGLTILIVSALLAAGIALGSTLETAYFGAYTYNIVSEIIDVGHAEILLENYIPIALFLLLFMAPFIVIFGIAYEWIAYQIFRIIGGKGTFKQQFYLSSFVSLPIAASTLISFLVPLPFLTLIAMLAMILVSLYFLLYVNPKAYQLVHNIRFVHAFLVVAALFIPRFLVFTFMLSEAGSFFGLPETLPYEITGVEYV
jgi:hypothetical protein